MWGVILNRYFTLENGYAHRPQYEDTRGFTDMITVHWTKSSAKPKQPDFS